MLLLGTIGQLVSVWAAEQPLIRRVYLFGSRARGDNRPDSDIDLAILNDIDAAELATCIRSALPRDYPDSAALALSARNWTFSNNRKRWQAQLAARFEVPVQLERPRKADVAVRPSLKLCRVLLYRRPARSGP